MERFKERKKKQFHNLDGESVYQIEAKTRLAYEASIAYKQNPQDFS
jgi:hypothetical protein